MTTITTLEVQKGALNQQRVTRKAAPDLTDGQVLVRIERYGLTANNVTYGVVGDRIGYWQFFPTGDDAWGVIPVWGIGIVEDSAVDDIAKGERLYGYWPMASHVVMQPDRVDDHKFFDGAAHRAELPALYNRYLRLVNDPNDDPATDDMRMVLWPLYATSYCLYDFAKDNDWFGAEQVLIVSASSKTGIGTGYAFKTDPDSPPVIALTSAGNCDKVRALGLYDDVVEYEDIETGLKQLNTLIIDMSGSGPVISRLHQHLGDAMRFTSHVGLTHFSDAGMGDGYIRDRSEMFFAPGHIAKRNKEWGPGEFERRSGAFWIAARDKSAAWLNLSHAQGVSDAQSAFNDVLSGRMSPDRAWTATIE